MTPLVSAADALDWAAGYFPFASCKLISKRAWGITYSLDREGTRAFLKIAPSVLPLESTLYPHLAALFPTAVPAVIATDPRRFLVLLADVGDRPFIAASQNELCGLLDAYAEMQVIAQRQSSFLEFLPEVQLRELVPSLLEFLGIGRDGNACPMTAWFTQHEIEEFRNAIAGRVSGLDALMASAGELPPTLNHGDLHPGNVGRRTDGRLVIYDWSEAVAGPAGMSLGCLIAPPAGEFGALQGSGSEASSPLTTLYETYAGALARGGYAPHAALRRVLPSAVVAGLIRTTVRFELFCDVDDDHRKFIHGAVTGGLESILSIAEYAEAMAIGH